MSYPPGSFGAERERLRAEIEALPRYCWPFKVRLRRQLRTVNEDAARRRDATIHDYFNEWESEHRKS